jgi:hypothetical protein
MTPLEIFFLIGTLLSMYWGYMSYRAAKGELQRLRRRRSLPRLLKERALLERLHTSPSERIAYMVEGVLISIGGLGALLMFSSIEFVSSFSSSIAAIERWVGGGAVYLFALYRLGKCNAATKSFESHIERINTQIKEVE